MMKTSNFQCRNCNSDLEKGYINSGPSWAEIEYECTHCGALYVANYDFSELELIQEGDNDE